MKISNMKCNLFMVVFLPKKNFHRMKEKVNFIFKVNKNLIQDYYENLLNCLSYYILILFTYKMLIFAYKLIITIGKRVNRNASSEFNIYACTVYPVSKNRKKYLLNSK